MDILRDFSPLSVSFDLIKVTRAVIEAKKAHFLVNFWRAVLTDSGRPGRF